MDKTDKFTCNLPNNVIKGKITFSILSDIHREISWSKNTKFGANADAYFIKFDDLGNIKLAKLFGSRSYDSARGLVVCRDGYIYITGSTENSFGDYTSTEKMVWCLYIKIWSRWEWNMAKVFGS